MSARHVVAICVTLLGAMALAPPAFAQQKTAKACAAEWRANKAENQASGVTEKAYVARCRTGAAPAEPTAAPAAPPPPAPGPTTSAPARPTPAKPAPTTTSVTPSGANEFSTAAAAETHCPGDTVVWANTKSRVYHYSNYKNYGNTKSGAYMCEKDTAGAGIRAAKNEKHP